MDERKLNFIMITIGTHLTILGWICLLYNTASTFVGFGWVLGMIFIGACLLRESDVFDAVEYSIEYLLDYLGEEDESLC